MEVLIHTIFAAIANSLIFFMILLVLFAAGAPESNGFWGLSSIGVGFMIGVPATLFIALPSGIAIGLSASRVIQSLPSIIAVSIIYAALVTVFLSLPSILDKSDNSGFFGSKPFLFAMAVCSVSNFLTLMLIRMRSHSSI